MDTAKPTTTDKAPAPPAGQVITEKNEAAARQLPDLFAALKTARAAIERIKSLPADHLNVHKISVIAGPDEYDHAPHDKKAWGDLLVRDLEAKAAAIADKIKALGFDPG